MISATHQVKQLLKRLADVEPYPRHVRPIVKRLPGVAFFPGGTGLWIGCPFPVGKVMVLGHNFGSVAKHGRDLKLGICDPCIRNKTWRGLNPFLKDVGLAPEACFFTNFFMGVIAGNTSEGPFPGASNPAFVARCQEFFKAQLIVQRPRVVLTLGRFVPAQLAPLAPRLNSWARLKGFTRLDDEGCAVVHDVQLEGVDSVTCSVVALVHPCRRSGTVGGRTYKRFTADEAEVQMVRVALKRCGIKMRTLPNPDRA